VNQFGNNHDDPPFTGVTLVEYRDRFEFTPIYWVREFVGLDRFKAKKIEPQPGEPLHELYSAVMGEHEIWVVARWNQYEDGREEAMSLECLDPEATEAEARKAYDDMVRFQALEVEPLVGIGLFTPLEVFPAI
jgi:hypothetical protein